MGLEFTVLELCTSALPIALLHLDKIKVLSTLFI